MLHVRLLGLVLVLVTPSIAGAQVQNPESGTTLLKKGLLGRGVEPGLYAKSVLLEIPSVQAELRLTDEQKRRLKQAEPEVKAISSRVARENSARARNAREQGDPEMLRNVMDQIGVRIRALTQEAEIPLLKVLDRRQRTRLEQIQLQAEGPLALSHPEVTERLNLSPEQAEEIRVLANQGYEAMKRSATVPGTGLTSAVKGRLTAEQREALVKSETLGPEIVKTRKAVLVTRRTAMQQIGRVLSKKQRAIYEAMLGEPFDFTKTWPGATPASEGSKP